MYEKTDRPNIVRDTTTKALINNDITKLNGYKIQKQKMREVDELKKGFADIKADLKNMRAILEEILKKVE